MDRILLYALRRSAGYYYIGDQPRRGGDHSQCHMTIELLTEVGLFPFRIYVSSFVPYLSFSSQIPLIKYFYIFFSTKIPIPNCPNIVHFLNQSS